MKEKEILKLINEAYETVLLGRTLDSVIETKVLELKELLKLRNNYEKRNNLST